MAITKLKDFKVRGLTDASATIATTDIDLWSDGTWRFTFNGKAVILKPGAKVNKLLQTIFTGTGGLDSKLHGTGKGLS